MRLASRLSVGVKVGVVLLLVLLDQESKAVYQADSVWNTGGVVGIFPGKQWVLLMAAVVVWIGWHWWKEKEAVKALAMSLVLAGGVGNIIDRLSYGAVRDFIRYPLVNVVGNVADIFLALGILVLVYSYFQKSTYDKQPQAD